MKADRFIARRLEFKGKMAVISMAISFFVIILSLSVAEGYRKEIRAGLASMCGDVILSQASNTAYGSESPMRRDVSFLEKIEACESAVSISPVIYRAGIVRKDGLIQGVSFKGVEGFCDSVRMGAVIPSKLATSLHLAEGDNMPVYFVGEKVKARSFKVIGVYDALIDAGGTMTVYASIEDIRRVNEWNENEVSALEIDLKDNLSRREIQNEAGRIGSIALLSATEEDGVLVATSIVGTYPQIFDWLDLIGVNVIAILALMIIVAGFNMISGLLIMLFRNISTIGILKSMGMRDSKIATVFLRVAARLVLKGMLAGNAAAILVGAIQNKTHFLTLNPDNYFISFVPMSLDWQAVVLTDAIAFVSVMLLLLIPSLFISRVDPAQSVKSD